LTTVTSWVYFEFGAHISATFISANPTRRRQSQRLFNSAPSNTALTHFGDLHFSEHNSPRHTFVRRFPCTSIFSYPLYLSLSEMWIYRWWADQRPCYSLRIRETLSRITG